MTEKKSEWIDPEKQLPQVGKLVRLKTVYGNEKRGHLELIPACAAPGAFFKTWSLAGESCSWDMIKGWAELEPETVLVARVKLAKDPNEITEGRAFHVHGQTFATTLEAERWLREKLIKTLETAMCHNGLTPTSCDVFRSVVSLAPSNLRSAAALRDFLNAVLKEGGVKNPSA